MVSGRQRIYLGQKIYGNLHNQASSAWLHKPRENRKQHQFANTQIINIDGSSFKAPPYNWSDLASSQPGR
jgi:hypothetical protein